VGRTSTQNAGLDRNAVNMTAAASRTYTFTGTGFDIFYWQFSGGGTFSYTVDGGSAVNVSTNGTTNTGMRNQAIRSLTAGSHTVVIAWVSGAVYFTGGFAYNGDEAKGIRSWVAAQPSSQSGYWYSASPMAWYDMLPNINPALVTVELMANDYNNLPAATSKTNVTSLIASVKSKLGYIPSFVLLPVWPISGAAATQGAYTDYITAQYDIAAADPDGAVTVCDLAARVGTSFPSTYGGLLDADNAHPSALGDRYIGETLAAFVSPR
jgi:hypothetical protein